MSTLLPQDKIAINTITFLWFNLSKSIRLLDDIRYTFLYDKGLKELDRLKKISTKGSDALNKALKNYEWVQDSIDYVPYPWVVCAKKQDDCDGSAWLLNELLTGKIYCIVEVKDGKARNYDNWHFVFQTSTHIWSNYKIASNNPDILKYVKSYNKKATHIIEINGKEFKIKNIIAI